jgi:pantoate--beta-alanine ligase
VELDYLALVDPDTLEAVDALERPALLALAARIGQVRLIDNAILQPTAGGAPTGKAIQTCSA